MDNIPDLRAEGFASQRIVRLPLTVIRRMRRRPFLRDFLVTDIGCYPKAPGHRVDRPAGSPGDILLFVTAGEGWVRVGGRTHKVKANQAIRLPARKAHAYGADKANPWGLYWLHMQGKGCSDLLSWTPFQHSKPVIACPAMESIRRHGNAAMDRMLTGYSDSALLELARRAVAILACLHRNSHLRERGVDEADQRINQSMEFMRSHLGQALNLADCARAANYSISRYSARFRALCGTSPLHYLRELRMQKACEMLDNGNEPVKAIALSVGYPDPLHFSRIFRTTTGMSPTEYRRREVG